MLSRYFASSQQGTSNHDARTKPNVPCTKKPSLHEEDVHEHVFRPSLWALHHKATNQHEKDAHVHTKKVLRSSVLVLAAAVFNLLLAPTWYPHPATAAPPLAAIRHDCAADGLHTMFPWARFERCCVGLYHINCRNFKALVTVFKSWSRGSPGERTIPGLMGMLQLHR